MTTQQQQDTIPVLFRKFPEGDIIALLPSLPVGGGGLIWAYDHKCVPLTASPSLVYRTTQARPEECVDMLATITGALGSKLTTISKIPTALKHKIKRAKQRMETKGSVWL